MPKIVDHEKYRLELAGRAVAIFTEFGYSGLGMRQIARELGISKSALYHYFPTKEALFAACTEIATGFDTVVQQDSTLTADAPLPERLKALGRIFQAQEADFAGELSLLIDYMRGMTPAQVAQDKNMQAANKNYHNLVSAFVGQANAKAVLCMMLGLLLKRFFDGCVTDWDEVQDQLARWMVTTEP